MILAQCILHLHFTIHWPPTAWKSSVLHKLRYATSYARRCTTLTKRHGPTILENCVVTLDYSETIQKLKSKMPFTDIPTHLQTDSVSCGFWAALTAFALLTGVDILGHKMVLISTLRAKEIVGSLWISFLGNVKGCTVIFWRFPSRIYRPPFYGVTPWPGQAMWFVWHCVIHSRHAFYITAVCIM